VGFLAHVGALFDADGDGVAERVYYNGFRPNTDIVGPVDYAEGDHFSAHPCGHDHSHADALGIETFAAHGIQARGVLIDLAAHYGRECRTVGYDDLMRVIEADGIVVEPGDILVLRTGFAEMVMEMAGQPDAEVLHHSCCALDGRDERLLQWITDSGIAAIAADNYAVERYPARPAPEEQGRCRCCRCIIIACSSSACRWASCGTCAISPHGCVPRVVITFSCRRRRCGCRVRWGRR
jgi:hypothetical protein